MYYLVRLLALIGALWCATHGPVAGLIIFGTAGIVLLTKDAIANPDLIREFWPAVLGGIVGLTVCWATGVLLVKALGSQGTVYVGPGLDRWNLPGTIFGVAIWIAAAIWGVKRHRKRDDTTRLP